MNDHSFERAARALKDAGALVITAGAGMSVDSGLPDFRGSEGFWTAYPMLGQRGVSFSAMANPTWFAREPRLAWGFYGHRYALYQATQPHEGYQTILRMAHDLGLPSFVYTSNVDGHFQRAGFDEEVVAECHGSLMHFQCARVCTEQVWAEPDAHFDVDPETLELISPLPTCRFCGRLARPAVLMFGDSCWVETRTRLQIARYAEFLRRHAPRRPVVIEIGAGLHVPSIRSQTEQLGSSMGATMVRINTRDIEGPRGMIPIMASGREALLGIEEAVRKL